MYLKCWLLFTGNVRHLALSGPINIPLLHYPPSYSTLYSSLNLIFFFSCTVIFILRDLYTIHLVTIHDTYCCIFVLRYIVARYIITPLVKCNSAVALLTLTPSSLSNRFQLDKTFSHCKYLLLELISICLYASHEYNNNDPSFS